MRFARLLTLLALWFIISSIAEAHEVRPAYLEITETEPGMYLIVWKQPVTEGRRLVLEPILPPDCTQIGTRQVEAIGAALITRWHTACDLAKAEISVEGLGMTLTDVIVSVRFLDERQVTGLLKPSAPMLSLMEGGGSGSSPVGTYLRLGITHILSGFDHLLFVAGLVLLVSMRQLLPVVTSFTLAHSLTLGLSALGWVSLPAAPVEILITLSIVLLAVEIVQRQQGRPGLAARKPWLIAFGFGLLHGFGFASALGGIGLPKGAELGALFLFNLGVEIGQVLFVGVLLIAAWLFGRFATRWREGAQLPAAYAIGSLAMFWTLERIDGAFPGQLG